MVIGKDEERNTKGQSFHVTDRLPLFSFSLCPHLEEVSAKPTKGKKPGSIIHPIIKHSKLHPFYLQMIGFEVWNSEEEIDETDVERCVSNLVEKNDYFYRTLIENLNFKYMLTILKMISNDEFSYFARELIK